MVKNFDIQYKRIKGKLITSQETSKWTRIVFEVGVVMFTNLEIFGNVPHVLIGWVMMFVRQVFNVLKDVSNEKKPSLEIILKA